MLSEKPLCNFCLFWNLATLGLDELGYLCDRGGLTSAGGWELGFLSRGVLPHRSWAVGLLHYSRLCTPWRPFLGAFLPLFGLVT